MVHNVALVLGGGGAAGQAWQIGVIAGLAEAGLDLTEAADLVIGTSSGSTTAAQVRSGIPAAELLTSVLSPPVQPAGQHRDPSPSLPRTAVLERMRAICAAAHPRNRMGYPVIALGSVRSVGTSDGSVPQEYPANAHPDVVNACVEAVVAAGVTHNPRIVRFVDPR